MKRGSIWGIVILIFCLAAIMQAAGAYATNSSSTVATSATAYHINAQHNGLQTDTLTPPLSHKWTKTLGGSAFYPLIAESKVFDTAITSQGEGLLYAFDISTGKTVWGPIDLGSSGIFAAATYDSGRVFTLNGTGVLQAFSAKDGSLLWATQITSQYSFSSPPTALNGLVAQRDRAGQGVGRSGVVGGGAQYAGRGSADIVRGDERRRELAHG